MSNSSATACIDGNEAAAKVAYCTVRGHRDLSDHAGIDDGRARRRVVGRRCDEPLGRGPRGRRDAVGGRRGRHAPRRAADRSARHDVHGIAGPAADAAQHVQDRRRADAGGDPRRGPCDRHARAVDLRRPQRRDGGPHDRFRDAVAELGAGSARLRRRVARRHACATRVPFLHFFDGFRTSHEINRIDLLDRRRPALARPRRRRRRAQAASPPADRAGGPRHGPEPRRVLPGPRGLEHATTTRFPASSTRCSPNSPS